jgi:hypothetical protein
MRAKKAACADSRKLTWNIWEKKIRKPQFSRMV